MDRQDFCIDFTIEDANGESIPMQAKGTVEWSYDPSYGEDIDGNRGTSRYTLSDFNVTSIREMILGCDRYDLIADEEVIQIIEERLLEDGPERE